MYILHTMSDDIEHCSERLDVTFTADDAESLREAEKEYKTGKTELL